MAIKECPSCHGTGKMAKMSRFKDEENGIDLSLRGQVICPNCYGVGAVTIIESKTYESGVGKIRIPEKQIPIIQIA